MTASTSEATIPVPKSSEKKSEWFENVKALGFALALFLVVRVLIFQPFTIPSQSMEPGLRPGDYIFVTKWDYGWSRYSIPFSPDVIKGRILARSPKRGDVIVFRVPSDRNRDYIKRLVGLPGDRVQVREGAVFLNGVELPVEDLGLAKATDDWPATVRALRETLPSGRRYPIFDQGYQMADDTDPFLVPEGHYFFMGDNRDNSMDSRFPTERGGVGLVPAERLIGRARFVMLSWEGASIFKPWTWFTKAKPERFFKAIE